MRTARFIDFLALFFIIVGALNWGLIAFFDLDIVASLFGGADSAVSKIIYGLVGISGLYGLTFFDQTTRENVREIE